MRAISTNPALQCLIAIFLSILFLLQCCRIALCYVFIVCRRWSLMLDFHGGFLCFYSENEGKLDQVKDNRVTLVIPLRYEVMLAVHG